MDINDFYSWLVPELDNLWNDYQLQKLVGKKLDELHPGLHWEIGPGETKEHFFAFSPNLNPEKIVITEKYVDSAPQLEHWEFLSAKPRKRWQKRTIRIKKQEKVKEINCDNWKYNLTSFKGGEFFDVNLLPVGCNNYSESDLCYFGDLLVQFELGERLFIDLIDRVNIIKEGSSNEPGIDITSLYEHLEELSDLHKNEKNENV